MIGLSIGISGNLGVSLHDILDAQTCCCIADHHLEQICPCHGRGVFVLVDGLAPDRQTFLKVLGAEIRKARLRHGGCQNDLRLEHNMRSGSFGAGEHLLLDFVEHGVMKVGDIYNVGVRCPF